MLMFIFHYSLQKKFESLFGDKLEVVRTHQQQENLKFLSHFKRMFVIRNGKRKLPNAPEEKPSTEFFHLRANGSPIATRCVQVWIFLTVCWYVHLYLWKHLFCQFTTFFYFCSSFADSTLCVIPKSKILVRKHFNTMIRLLTLQVTFFLTCCLYEFCSFSYILMVPFDSQDLKGIVYVWIGGLAEHEDAVVAEKIAYKMYQVSFPAYKV